MKNNRILFLLSSALVLPIWPAMAANADAVTDQAAQTTGADSASGSDDGGIAEITVTAQRRDQRLQDVPVAVSVATSDTLTASAVQSTDQLGQIAPNLNRTRQHGVSSTFLRGVGTSFPSTGGESSVAFYVDGVYMPSQSATIMGFNNIERVEVLRGPQGTLFGRNATGGLIQVVTRDPSAETQLNMSASYGSYDTIGGNVYASTGIGENAAIDISGYFKNQGKGFGRNLFNGKRVYQEDSWAVRSKLVWDPSDNTEIKLALDHSETKGDLAMHRIPRPGTRQGDANNALTKPGGQFDFSTNASPFYDLVSSGVSLQIGQEIGAIKLVSISSYRHEKTDQYFDVDSSPFALTQGPSPVKINTYSQELQLLSNTDGPLSFVSGFYYFLTKADNSPGQMLEGAAIVASIRSVAWDNVIKSRSVAVYGEVRYELMPSTALTVGGRFTWDRQDLYGTTILSFANGNTTIIPYDVDTSWSEPTYRAVLEHRFSPDVMVYGSYSHGYKSGLYNSTVNTGVPAAPVDPEKIDSFEIGMKSDLLDRKLRLNLTAFHYKWKNQQLFASFGPTNLLLNAGEAKASGIEAEIVARPLPQLTLSAAAGYLDAEYTLYDNGPNFIPRPAPGGGNTVGAPLNYAGNSLARTPDFTATTSIRYEIPTSSGDFSAQLTYYYNNGFAWDSDNRVNEPSYGLLSAELGWKSPDETYGFRLNASNLTNTKYAISGQPNSFGDAYAPGLPRTITATVDFKF